MRRRLRRRRRSRSSARRRRRSVSSRACWASSSNGSVLMPDHSTPEGRLRSHGRSRTRLRGGSPRDPIRAIDRSGGAQVLRADLEPVAGEVHARRAGGVVDARRDHPTPSVGDMPVGRRGHGRAACASEGQCAREPAARVKGVPLRYRYGRPRRGCSGVENRRRRSGGGCSHRYDVGALVPEGTRVKGSGHADDARHDDCTQASGDGSGPRSRDRAGCQPHLGKLLHARGRLICLSVSWSARPGKLGTHGLAAWQPRLTPLPESHPQARSRVSAEHKINWTWTGRARVPGEAPAVTRRYWGRYPASAASRRAAARIAGGEPVPAPMAPTPRWGPRRAWA
jgi:hypothetical protein